MDLELGFIKNMLPRLQTLSVYFSSWFHIVCNCIMAFATSREEEADKYGA